MTTRLLHVIDTGGPGGAETVLTRIVEGLDRSRFSSRVVVPYQDWLYGRLLEIGADVTVIPRGRSPDLAFLHGLARDIRSFRPHVLHTHLMTSSVYSSILATFMGQMPLVATFHGLPDVSDGARWLPLKSRILSRPQNHVVFVAAHLRKALQARLGLPDRMCQVVPNGIRMDRLRPRTGPPPSAHTRRVGAIGNIRPAKDYPTLLRAAKALVEDMIDVVFLIAGSGTEEDIATLEAMRDDLGLENVVSFVGFVRDTTSFIHDLDVFVSSSVTEGSPLAILEAASTGCPIVATRCGGNEETLGSAGAASLVPAGDARALARGIKAVLADLPQAYADAASVAREVRRTHDVSLMVKGYSELYQRAVHEASALPNSRHG